MDSQYSANMWPEVTIVLKEHRKELVISGSDQNILQRIETVGFDPRIFALRYINFLEVSRCKLTEVPEKISTMSNLTSLSLHSNHLQTIPTSVNMLSKLHLLDLSFNQLENLPALDSLSNLDTLNVSSNCLTCLPDLSKLENLHVLIAGNNKLDEFPENLASDKLVHLHTIKMPDNEICNFPPEICSLKSLKTLDLQNNKIKNVPCELSLCNKLKDLSIKGNKLADRRLQKLVDQLHTKHVTDYLSQIYDKEEKARQSKVKKNKKPEVPLKVVNEWPKLGEEIDVKKEEKQSAPSPEEEFEPNDGNVNVNVIHFDAGIKAIIDVKENVLPVRSQVLACIVRNLDLKRSTNMFKRFISMQNNLHDGVCDKRQAATIATHDLNTCFFPMSYEARGATSLEITPLFAQKPITARQLVENLVAEADEIRRQKKRNAFTGLHKYLSMPGIRGAQNYACLVDSQGTVVSFPPITNALKTKCVKETRDVLFEVTSRSSEIARRVMAALITEVVELVSNPGPENGARPTLTLEQVRIHDAKGQLKSVYPSSVDLKDDPRLNVVTIFPENKKGG